MNLDPKKLAEQYKPKEVKQLKPDRQLCMIRFSPDGKVLAGACQDGSVRRWDFSAEQIADMPPLAGHGGWVQAIVFHADNKRLFSVDSWGGLRAWPYADKDAKPLWANDKAHDGWIRSLALISDSKLLATCGIDQMVRVFSADDGKKVHEFAGHNVDVFSVAFHPDGKSVVSGDLKGIVKQWELASGKVIREYDAKVLYMLSRLQDTGGARFLTFDKTGNSLACAGCQIKGGATVQGMPTVLFFDTQTGKLQHTFKVGTENDCYIHDLAFHPDGFMMGVSSGLPGVGKLFFFVPGVEQPFYTSNLPNCHSLALQPNSQRLVVSATNGGSNGNGRAAGKEYPGNFSPLHVLDLLGQAGGAIKPAKK